MGILCHPAMTAQELSAIRPLPPAPAWMSCHFRGRELGNLPSRLPPGSLLILDDSILPEDPDPVCIGRQLEACIQRLSCCGLLLDFQRPEEPGLQAVARHLDRVLPCPVALPEVYGRISHGPVFLTLLPPHRSLEAAAASWPGRELWLELGPTSEVITLTAAGAAFDKVPGLLPPCPLRDIQLCCSYGISCEEDRAVFTLIRRSEDLKALLTRAEDLGISRAVGLWGEIRQLLPF